MAKTVPYTNRELDHYFGDMRSDIKEMKETTVRIETQTMKTNGRVNKLEWWRNAIVWGAGALVSAAVIIFPLLRSIVKNEIQRSVQVSVEESVHKTLAGYGFEFEQ